MPRRRLIVFAGCCLLIAAGAGLLLVRGELRVDMSFFMPRAANPQTRFLVDRLRTGPASNILLISLSGAAPKELARMSDRLVRRIRADGRFTLAANGRLVIDPPSLAWIVRYRYLLNPATGPGEYETASLRKALQAAAASLATATGLATKDFLPRDPTGRVLRVARALAGTSKVGSRFGVWFAADGKSALIVTRTKAGGLDIAGQAEALLAVRQWFARIKGAAVGRAGAQLELSGPGVLAVISRDRIKDEMWWLSIAASGLVILLMVAVFRSLPVLLVLGLPLAAGVIGGAAAVQLVFGNIHGITLTFGATLVGISFDYPLHLAAHASGGKDARETARRIWPTLRLSVLTTVAAFVPFTLSSFPGLAQLGVISIAGLLIVAAMTRWVLPSMLPSVGKLAVPSLVSWSPGVLRAGATLRAGTIVLLALGAAWIAFASPPVWEDDLSRLSPLSPQQLRIDRRLRAEVSTLNARYMLVLSGAGAEAVLRKSEAAGDYLRDLQKQKKIVGFDSASRYLPSARSQKARQAMLPGAQTLRRNLDAALLGSPFRKGTFEPFLEDVQAAKSGAIASLGTLAGTQVAIRVNSLMFESEGRWFALILFKGGSLPLASLSSAPELRALDARFLDLKAEADALVSGYRNEALLWLVLGAGLSFVVLFVGLRRLEDVLRVSVPVVLAVLITACLLLISGTALSLFHLMALLVVAGIGFDYALFLRRHGASEADEGMTFRAVTLCGITTIAVFSVLAFSSLPILHGIGLTVALGAALALPLARLFTSTSR